MTPVGRDLHAPLEPRVGGPQGMSSRNAWSLVFPPMCDKAEEWSKHSHHEEDASSVGDAASGGGGGQLVKAAHAEQ